MKLFTAKITSPSGNVSFVNNALWYRGYLFQYFQGRKRAIFRSVFIFRTNMKDIQFDPDRCIEGMPEALIHKSATDYEVEDMTEKKAREKAQEQNAYLNQKRRIEVKEGIFGYRLPYLPKDIFDLVAQHAFYKGKDAYDEAVLMGFNMPGLDDVTGWFYEIEAIDILVSNGFPVSYKKHGLFGSITQFRGMLQKEADSLT